MHRIPILTASVLSLTAAAALGQAKVSLTKPDAEFAEPFTNVSSVREMPNGKVLMVDMEDRVVQMLDFATGKITKVGRTGKGPGEYSMPGELLPLPSGETLLNDMGSQRFLVIGTDGKPGKTLKMPDLSGGGMGFFSMGPGGVKVDAAGNIYFQGPPPMPVGMPGAAKKKKGQRDSMLAVVRWNRTGSKVDTVSWVLGPKFMMEDPVEVSSSAVGGGAFAVAAVSMPKIFAPAEAWGVLGDGSIVRLQPNPYRLVRYPAGKGSKPVIGPSQPYTPIKVTEQEKEAFKKGMRTARTVSFSVSADGASEVEGPPIGNIEMPGLEFEDTKPPFGDGMMGGSVLFTPEGETWVLRMRALTDSVPTYDVFDAKGTVIKKVSLAPNSHIVGFSKGTIYVIRKDADDLQYLQRYKR